MSKQKHPMRGLRIGKAKTENGKSPDKLRGLAPTNHGSPMSEPTVQTGAGKTKIRGAKPRPKLLPTLEEKPGNGEKKPADSPPAETDASNAEAGKEATAGQGSADANADGHQQVPPGDRDVPPEQRGSEQSGSGAGHESAD